ASSRPSSAPVTWRSPSWVNTPNSTAVSRTLEDQKAKAVCKIGLGSRGELELGMNHKKPKGPAKRKRKTLKKLAAGRRRRNLIPKMKRTQKQSSLNCSVSTKAKSLQLGMKPTLILTTLALSTTLLA